MLGGTELGRFHQASRTSTVSLILFIKAVFINRTASGSFQLALAKQELSLYMLRHTQEKKKPGNVDKPPLGQNDHIHFLNFSFLPLYGIYCTKYGLLKIPRCRPFWSEPGALLS